MRILYVATVVKTHIMEFHIPYLKMLKEMGWETAVAARNDYEDPKDCVIPYCDEYFDISFERNPLKPGNIRAYKMLKKVIDNGNYDIIHCHTPVGGALTRIAAKTARKRGTKVFYTAHGFHFFNGAPIKNWIFYYPSELILSRYTDVLITINHEDYERAKKKFYAKKTEYIPGIGVDTKRFQVCPVDRVEKRESLGVEEKEFLLLSVGELNERKNPVSIIEALHIVDEKKNIEGLKYICVGSGDLKEEIEHKIIKYNLSDHVQLLGYRTDVDELCLAADCFIHPSVREGLGIAPLEAMASGLPLIASNINGMQEYIEDGKTGCCIDPNNWNSIADAIIRMKNDSVFREACGIYNADAVKKYDIKVSEENMKKIYVGGVYRNLIVIRFRYFIASNSRKNTVATDVVYEVAA